MFLCRHEYELIDKIKVNYCGEYKHGCYFALVLMCKKCGKVKTKHIR